MKKLSPEELLAAATAFTMQLVKNSNKAQLATYRNFFLCVSNNLLTIILEQNNI